MSVKCQVLMDIMEQIAPRNLAESWDNVGLLIGSPAQSIDNIMVCLDVNEAVLDCAVRQKVDLLIAHHPVIFQAVKNLRSDLPQGRLLTAVVKNNISVFAAHTNLDSAVGGVNDILADKLGLLKAQPLAESYQTQLLKLVVFVPAEYAETVKTAIGNAGAGYIGKYSHCNFSVAGQGQFKPLAGAEPFIGESGIINNVAEMRIETIIPEKLARKVVKAMLAVHPYEEVAYDLYPLKNSGEIFGLGRIGMLDKALPLEEFAVKVKSCLPSNHIRFVKSGTRTIKKVAVCSGSGADFIVKAAYSGADVLVTGDLKYHEAQKAQDYGIHIIDAGHYGTEIIVVAELTKRLQAIAAAKKLKVNIIAASGEHDPINIL